MEEVKYSFDEIERYIRSLPLLKLTNEEVSDMICYEDTLSCVRSILSLITCPDYRYCTLSGTISIDGEETCRTERRSITDIYRTLIYYKPDVSFEDCISCIKLLAFEQLRSFNCPDIGRRVYRWCGSINNAHFSDILTDEYHNDFSELKGKVSQVGYASSLNLTYINIPEKFLNKKI